MDEWGFPIANDGGMVDDWGFPVESQLAQVMYDEFGNPITGDQLAYLQQQQLAEQNLMQQQMLTLQQNSQYAQQELMYSAQSTNMKYMNAMMKGRQVHYTTHEIINGLKSYVASVSGGIIPRELIKLEDFPQTLRHACAYTKEIITYLPLYYFNIPEIGTQIPFYFCKACGRLYYPRDIIGGYY